MYATTKTIKIWRVVVLLITIHCSFFTASAQGWPSDYKGVMLQGFYWDGYTDSKWTTLVKQADELSAYFNLIWIPQSGKTSEYYHTKRQTMGYDPCFWLDHNSCWGTEAELKKMIKTFKDKGTGIIEDVVINHKNGLNTWVDFPDETNGKYSITWDNTNYSGICSDDECNKNGYKTTGAKDTGDPFDGYRDLDHTNETVQKNVKTYLDFLLNELGYAGFRYDMVKGYAAKYTGMYNASANPIYSVGEFWDGNKTLVTNWINSTKVDGKIQSAAFDFPMKYKINSAFGGGNWSALGEQMLSNDNSYKRYSVTFVDNHDTYRDNNKLSTNVCAANAYILTMPGTPCLFLKHWQSNKGTLKRLIAIRKAAGISNESEITSANASTSGFTLKVKGENGTLLLLLGSVDGADANGYQLALEGKKFKLYASSGIDLSEVKAITDGDDSPEDDSPVEVPSFCQVNEGETCAFFVAPKSWGSQIKCWRWDRQYNYTGNVWPGVNCTKLGEDSKGQSVWKWTYKASDRKSQTSSNEGIIFNDGTNQTADLAFTNGGYYNLEGLQAVVSSTGLRELRIENSELREIKVYSIDGRFIRSAQNGSDAISGLKKGIYIINNRKVIVK
jgi:alpha-amylase